VNLHTSCYTRRLAARNRALHPLNAPRSGPYPPLTEGWVENWVGWSVAIQDRHEIRTLRQKFGASPGLTPFGAALRGYIDRFLSARDHHDATDSSVLVTDPAGVIPLTSRQNVEIGIVERLAVAERLGLFGPDGPHPFGAALRGYIDRFLSAHDHHDATDSPVLITDPPGVIPPRRYSMMGPH
jgi:hypothetical protein